MVFRKSGTRFHERQKPGFVQRDQLGPARRMRFADAFSQTGRCEKRTAPAAPQSGVGWSSGCLGGGDAESPDAE
jgi:hypothetical protein